MIICYYTESPEILSFFKENGLIYTSPYVSKELSNTEEYKKILSLNQYQEIVDTPLVGEESNQENNDSILSWCTIL